MVQVMAQETWILTDVDADKYVDTIAITPQDVGGAAQGYTVRKRRLHGGLRDGVDAVEIDNGQLSLVILPTRGMGIWRASWGEVDIGWRSPNRGPVHPRWVPLMEPSGLGWLDGFDELLVRCGLESNGAPDFDLQGRLKYPLHGRIANRPAQFLALSVDGDSGEIELTGVVEETRFHFTKLRLTSSIRTKVGQPGFRVHDEVENLAGTTSEMQLLYHMNFGPPVLESDSLVLAPIETLVPRDARAAEGISTWNRFGPPTAGIEEQVYFARLLADGEGRTQALLKNGAGDLGISIDFPIAQLPCFTLWKNSAAEKDGYVTGLEPGTNYPNPRTYETEQGRVISLPPGGKATFEIGLTVLGSSQEVVQAENMVANLQNTAEPQIFDAPQAGWCSP